jgi:hypothetical protein
LMKKELRVLKRQREDMKEKHKLHLEAAENMLEQIEHQEFLIMDYEQVLRKVES